MVGWKRTRYLYQGRGFTRGGGTSGKGGQAAGSGRFRVGEQVWRGEV